jgi:glucose/arabinose dehydrogenase
VVGEGFSGRSRLAAVVAAFGCLVLFAIGAPGAHAAEVPAGFQDATVFSGIDEPTAIRFAPDGRAFVAEKKGTILVYTDLADTTPTVFADLSEQVYGAGDRGLLGLELDPKFPERPYVYALYTYDHQLGDPDPKPRWNDVCPTPPGFETNGCVASGRLVKLTAAGDHSSGEEVLIEGWCQQFPSHSVGALQFDSTGALYVSAGDGASYNGADYGQFGYPQKNPCGDPPTGVGGNQTTPGAEGGALRSQDLRTLSTAADPTGLNGSLLRIDPDTGAGLPGNPLASSLDQNERRVVAYGFRNPFRFAINPATSEVYVGNVGAEEYDEIDRFNPTSGQLYNSGWPCFEGPEPNATYIGLGLNICDGLYADPNATAVPFFYYYHRGPLVPEDPCPYSNGNALSGMAFYEGEAFPASYEGALFFSDSVRGCIYAMFAGPDGRPDPSTLIPFVSDTGLYPGIDIEVGPEGDLFYTELFGPEFSPGSVHRVSYFSGNQPPVAQLEVDQAWSPGPLTATFDAGESSDADGEPLSYEWDLEGDGSFEPPSSTSVKSREFSAEHNAVVAVRVKDPSGASGIDRVTVYPYDTPPTPLIAEPASTLKWAVGDPISFEGEAWDEEDTIVPTTSLDWSTRLFHCPSGCHAHPLEAFPAVAAGSFAAPDHEYPSYIEVRLTAVDSRGLTASRAVEIYPETVQLSIAASTPGLLIGAGSKTAPAPFELTVIRESSVSLVAPATQLLDGRTYSWEEWSDGDDRVHSIVAEESARYQANYSMADLEPPEPPEVEPPERPGSEPAPAPEATPPTAAPIPSTALLRHPKKRGAGRVAKFSFAGEPAGVAFRCKLDRKPFRDCDSPKEYARLAPGPHRFQVVAIAPLSGSADPTAAEYRWTVAPWGR